MREAGKLCEKMENAIAAAVDRPRDLLQLWMKGNACL